MSVVNIQIGLDWMGSMSLWIELDRVSKNGNVSNSMGGGRRSSGNGSRRILPTVFNDFTDRQFRPNFALSKQKVEQNFA